MTFAPARVHRSPWRRRTPRLRRRPPSTRAPRANRAGRACPRCALGSSATRGDRPGGRPTRPCTSAPRRGSDARSRDRDHPARGADGGGCGHSWARASAHGTGAEPNGASSALVGLSAQEALDLGGELVAGGELSPRCLFEAWRISRTSSSAASGGVEPLTLRRSVRLEVLIGRSRRDGGREVTQERDARRRVGPPT